MRKVVGQKQKCEILPDKILLTKNKKSTGFDHKDTESGWFAAQSAQYRPRHLRRQGALVLDGGCRRPF